MKKRNQGFTLVEIMIVVVIIGLLAAMAIPAFQRVRVASITSALHNDARQLGSAAQQYFIEHSVTRVTVTYDVKNGEVTGQLQPYVSQLSRGYNDLNGDDIDSNLNFVWSFGHPLVGLHRFNPEGQYIPN